MSEGEYRWPSRQDTNVYKNEIINSCAKIVEDAAHDPKYSHARPALIRVAKSIRALAGTK
jgi:hypothetical protein